MYISSDEEVNRSLSESSPVYKFASRKGVSKRWHTCAQIQLPIGHRSCRTSVFKDVTVRTENKNILRNGSKLSITQGQQRKCELRQKRSATEDDENFLEHLCTKSPLPLRVVSSHRTK